MVVVQDVFAARVVLDARNSSQRRVVGILFNHSVPRRFRSAVYRRAFKHSQRRVEGIRDYVERSFLLCFYVGCRRFENYLLVGVGMPQGFFAKLSVRVVPVQRPGAVFVRLAQYAAFQVDVSL